MDVTKEAIEKILSLAEAQVLEVDGFQYANRELKRVDKPSFGVYSVSTLRGLVDLVQILVPKFAEWKGLMCHVSGVQEVEVFTRDYASTRSCQQVVVAQGDIPHPFEFGRFVGTEDFCIGLLSKFVHDEAMQALYAIASNLTATQSRQDEDVGIGQRVVVKAGMATVNEVVVSPHHVLRPFRTFPDVEQPASRFLFRVKFEKDHPPRCALFEADGGAWMVVAKANIKTWLVEQLGPDVPVVA